MSVGRMKRHILLGTAKIKNHVACNLIIIMEKVYRLMQDHLIILITITLTYI